MQRQSRGFSLIELLVVVFISLLIMAYAVPSAVRMTHKMRLKNAAGEYQNLLQQTRVRAIQDDRFYQAKIQIGTAATPIIRRVSEPICARFTGLGDRCWVIPFPFVSSEVETRPSTTLGTKGKMFGAR